MKIFLAGIMQGSHVRELMHDQDYRSQVRSLLERHLPGAEVYDPLADHGESLTYDDNTGRAVFMRHNRMCGEVDLVVAIVPEASMGTAIEMWEAHRCGKLVVTISPLKHNWAVKFLSQVLYHDLEELTAELQSGELARRLKAMGLES